MKRTLMFLAGVVLLCAPVLKAEDSGAAQVERGRQLFLNSAKGRPCATCHSMEGAGSAIGPDLKRLASVIGPRGLVMTIQMSMTAYVQEVKLINGHTFPGLQKEKDKGVVEMWDLSKVPATLLKLKDSEIASQKTNTAWKHPPASAGYNNQELADIIGYLKFASTGVQKEVTTAELK